MKLIIIITLILNIQLVFGQSTSIGRDNLLFEKGFLLQELVEEEFYFLEEPLDSLASNNEVLIDLKVTILEKALDYYQELIDSFPSSSLLYRALNNKGFIELSLDYPEEAKKTFITIINGMADDTEKGGTGSGLMGEPYTNYKNRASKVLAEIFIRENNFKEALNYLNLTEQYPYRHFCGNAYATDEIYMSKMYAKCYLGLNDLNKAYEILLPNLLENGFADNSDLVDITYHALLKTYSEGTLKQLYADAFKNYKVEEPKSGKNEYEKYFITFLDTKIEIISWRLYYMSPEEKEKEIENIYKASRFYTLLNN